MNESMLDLLPNLSEKVLQNQCSTKQLVILDAQIEDVQQLAAGVIAGVEVVVLDPEQDGVQQITEILAQQQHITHLHILSHGLPGALQLGSNWLSLATLEGYRQDLQAWSGALATDAHISLYGCRVAAGAAGRNLLAQLSELTGAGISASENLTGNADLGGDWRLEVTTGAGSASLPFTEGAIANYASVLVPIWAITDSGDFNGDGTDDLLLTSLSQEYGTWILSNGSVSSFTPFPYIDPASGWFIIGAADLDGNNTDDILLANIDGSTGGWIVDNGAVVAFAPGPYIPPTSNWEASGFADFNGDNTDDVLLTNSVEGRQGIWTISGGQITGFSDLPYVDPASGWSVIGAGDINGDATDDIILANDDGNTGAWLITNAIVQGFVQGPYLDPSSGWLPINSGDFNGDGKDDILLQNQFSNAAGLWMVGDITNNVVGITFNALPYIDPTSNWDIVGVADVNGNGTDDIILSNPNGANLAWLVSNGAVSSAVDLPFIA
jgi:hypothetical protein